MAGRGPAGLRFRVSKIQLRRKTQENKSGRSGCRANPRHCKNRSPGLRIAASGRLTWAPVPGLRAYSIPRRSEKYLLHRDSAGRPPELHPQRGHERTRSIRRHEFPRHLLGPGNDLRNVIHVPGGHDHVLCRCAGLEGSRRPHGRDPRCASHSGMAVLRIPPDGFDCHRHAGAVSGHAEWDCHSDLPRIPSLPARPVCEGNVSARWIVLSVLRGAGFLYSCPFAQQIYRLFRLYYLPGFEHLHLGSVECRHLPG